MQVTFICIRSLICWRRSGLPRPQLHKKTTDEVGN